jgi:hypothetical protein
LARLDEKHLRAAVREFVDHYHEERPHQGLGSQLIAPQARGIGTGPLKCRERLGGAESGDAHYRQALTLAEPRGMRPLVADGHCGLARLFERTGQRERAAQHLATASAMYRDMDVPVL